MYTNMYAPLYMSSCMHKCIQTCKQTYLQTYLHTLHAYIHSYMPTYIPTYITGIHTYKHAYITYIHAKGNPMRRHSQAPPPVTHRSQGPLVAAVDVPGPALATAAGLSHFGNTARQRWELPAFQRASRCKEVDIYKGPSRLLNRS